MSVSRKNVIDCYRYIAGREPEGEKVIVNHMMGHKDLLGCHRAFYGSPEYKKHHPGMRSFSRLSPLGGIETLGCWDEPGVCRENTEPLEILRLYHEAVRQGKPCLMVIDEKGEYLGKIVTKESIVEGEKTGNYFLSLPSRVEVGRDIDLRIEVFNIWDAWHSSYPNKPIAPVPESVKQICQFHRST